MEKVKDRMKQFKLSIEEAQERETDAKNGVREVEAKIDKLGGEKTTLESRINVVQAEYEKILERLKDSQDKLEYAHARTEESESHRLQLAETEVDDFERSEDVANTLKVAAVSKESAAHLVAEAERKVVVLERDLARAEEKCARFTECGDELQERLENQQDDIRQLEEKDRDASEREDESEAKIKLLESALREVSGAAESNERNASKLERLKDSLLDDILSWRGKREEVRKEMEECNLVDED